LIVSGTRRRPNPVESGLRLATDQKMFALFTSAPARISVDRPSQTFLQPFRAPDRHLLLQPFPLFRCHSLYKKPLEMSTRASPMDHFFEDFC
jgi:hypothetical protein